MTSLNESAIRQALAGEKVVEAGKLLLRAALQRNVILLNKTAHLAAGQAAALKRAVEIRDGPAAQNPFGQYPAECGFVDKAHHSLADDRLLRHGALCAVPDLHGGILLWEALNFIIA